MFDMGKTLNEHRTNNLMAVPELLGMRLERREHKLIETLNHGFHLYACHKMYTKEVSKINGSTS